MSELLVSPKANTMTIRISRTSPIADVGRGAVPSLCISKCERKDCAEGTDDDSGPARHGYTTSYTPTIIIAIREERFGLGPGDIVEDLMAQADIRGEGVVMGVGWIGDTKTVLWATVNTVEAAEALQEFVVQNRELGRAGVEIFSVTYVYDD